MDNEKLKKVAELLNAEKANDANALFHKIAPFDSVEYWLVRGNLKQKFQQWNEAINAYSKVLELEPGNPEAENQLHIVQNILNFWNPEMFNP